jgi:hypothetical protein
MKIFSQKQRREIRQIQIRRMWRPMLDPYGQFMCLENCFSIRYAHGMKSGVTTLKAHALINFKKHVLQKRESVLSRK